MAYCDQCGAYIPDGQTVCLACGYDEAKAAVEENGASAAQAAQQEYKPEQNSSYYSFTNEELKERLAEQRKKQRDESRRWAEEEKARRQAAREAQSAKAAEAAAEEDALNWDEVLGMDEKPRTKRSTITGSRGGDSKLFGALSYLGPLFLLPMIFKREDKFAGFHAKQGMILFIFNILSRFLRRVPVLGALMKLFRYYCIYVGMKSSVDGRKEELPYIGKFGR